MCTNNKNNINKKNLNQNPKILENQPILNETPRDINNQTEKELQQEILKIKNKMNEIKLRSQANIENLKKQTIKKIKEIKQESLKNFSRRLIQIIEHLEKTIKKLKCTNNVDNAIMQGLTLTIQALFKATTKIGLKKEKKKETKFDPTIHEIISTEKSKNVSENNIVTIIKPGYTLNDIVLQKSIVKISENRKQT